MITAIKNYLHKNIRPPKIKERGVVEAYDVWAPEYDSQPGNLMLDLDELVFTELLATINLSNKNIADVGCGTGRHWPKIISQDIDKLTGFDVSPGMLGVLNEKFPEMETHLIADNHFTGIAAKTYDLIVSTLTIAHIENLQEALTAWSRILKDAGDIILTDFHPSALASGGQRTFKHGNSHIAVRNFVHPTATIISILQNFNFKLVAKLEKTIDETVKHYYDVQNAMHIYERFKGFPIIYGLHFRRV